MNQPGFHTHQEILSQPAVWEESLEIINLEKETLRQFFRTEGFDQVIFTGCGSTYYLSLAAAALFQELVGSPAYGVPASEIWLSPNSAFARQRRTLLVVISRSGETTETLRACAAFSQRGAGELLTLGCYPEAPLAKIGRINLVFPAAREESVAQTRAFSTLYMGVAALVTLWAGRADLFDNLSKLPEIGSRILQPCVDLARQFGGREDLDRVYFLGSGARYGLACELSLKMKEMSLTHSEPFHFLEFRHGPVSMVTEGALLVGLLSEDNRLHEQPVLAEVAAKGGAVLSIAEKDANLSFSSELDPSLRNTLYLPAGQLLAFERALSKGLDPDRPKNLSSVVRLSNQPGQD